MLYSLFSRLNFRKMSKTIRSIHCCSSSLIRVSLALNAEPLKKKKKIDRQTCINLFRSITFSRYVSTEAPVKPNVNDPDRKQTGKSNQPLKISESCLKRLQEVCKDGSFLRVTVEGGGCSGFTYKFDLDTKLNDDDIVFDGDKDGSKGKVVIDTTSLEYCSGATVDYHTELIRSGFRITNNPKAEAGCSCGSSFALRLD